MESLSLLATNCQFIGRGYVKELVTDKLIVWHTVVGMLVFVGACLVRAAA